MADFSYGTQRKIKGYGWRPSLPDHRDIVADTSGLPVAPEVDPRGDYMTEVYDQEQLGACTANAVAAAVDADRIVNGEEPFYPSRLVIYALERLKEGSALDQDTGAYGRDGFKVCRNVGMVPESADPYSDKQSAWSKDPFPILLDHKSEVITLERPYKAVRRSTLDFKRALTNRQTIAFGFTVYDSFESGDVARTGVVPMPGPDENVLGGHEVLMVGYLKSEPNHVLVRNSWGSGWGESGYFLMPLAYLLDHNLASDFRTIYRPAS